MNGSSIGGSIDDSAEMIREANKSIDIINVWLGGVAGTEKIRKNVDPGL
jgi:hypothetical protein